MKTLELWTPHVLSILRIMAALLFLQHGLMKLFEFPGPQPGLPSHLPPLLIAAAILELIGGIMLASGLFSRIIALICSGEMAVGYFITHAPRGFYPALNGGELAVLYCFVFFFLVFAGGGRWSLDTLIHKWRIERLAGSND